MSAAASPPPSVFEQDISLGPAQDDSLSSEEEEGSRGWRPRHGSEETHSEVVAAPGAHEPVTAASRSTPRDAESMDCGPPLGSQTVIGTVTPSRLCSHLTPLLHPNHFPWMTCSGGTDGAVPGDAAGGASSFHTQFRGALERLEVHWGRDGGGGTLTSHRGGACP